MDFDLLEYHKIFTFAFQNMNDLRRLFTDILWIDNVIKLQENLYTVTYLRRSFHHHYYCHFCNNYHEYDTLITIIDADMNIRHVCINNIVIDG